MLSVSSCAALLTVALLGSAACSDLQGPLGDVDQRAGGLKSLVDKWSASSGLEGALSIQDQFPALSSAVAALSQAAGSVSEAAVEPSSVTSLAESISALLQSLTLKASDFKTVGASDIVANDISSLKQPAVDIINSIARAVSANCEKAGSLSPALHNIVQGFSSADANYNLPGADFPTTIACAGSASNAGATTGSTAPPRASARVGPALASSGAAGYAASDAPALAPPGAPSYALPGPGNPESVPAGFANTTVPVWQSNTGVSNAPALILAAVGVLAGTAALLIF